MMKILQINATFGIGSTGKIVSELNDIIASSGHIGYVLCGTSKNNETSKNIYAMSKSKYFIKKNLLRSRITGRMGYTRFFETKKAIKWVNQIKPDIIHLHVIHGNYLNVKLLFDFIKKTKIPVIWTLHDCWSFTGRCSYFEQINCFKWKKECFKCKLKGEYPISYFFDFSKSMYRDKKNWFSNVDRLTIVCPSYWLNNYVKDSFLGHYDSLVIHNGINLDTYKPLNETNNIVLQKKRIILGVASSWSKRKGLADFIKLNSLIDKNQYQIMLIGLNNKQISILPKDIIGIKRTNNEEELVEYYNQAFVFLNLTYLDNYPTTNLEAQACGTPLITYKTGGSIESACIADFIVDQGDIDSVIKIIDSIEKERSKIEPLLLEYSKKHFDKKVLFNRYIDLYEQIGGALLNDISTFKR